MKKNTTTEKWFFGLLAFAYIAILILHLLVGTRDWYFILGIEEDSIVVKSDIVPEKSATNISALGGPSIFITHVNPNNPNQIIANSYSKKYLSLDHGTTWSEITEAKCSDYVVWVDNTILISKLFCSKEEPFLASDNFGVSWKPVTINTNSNEQIKFPKISENYEVSWKSISLSKIDKETLYRSVSISLNEEGLPILTLSIESEYSQYYFKLDNNTLTFQEPYIRTGKQKIVYSEDILFTHGKIRASVSESKDGFWAATDGGVFFKKYKDTLWQDKSASFGAHSFSNGFESQQGSKLLALDPVGRLAISGDKGKSWKSLANNVSKAQFLADESIVVVQQSGRVIQIAGDETLQLSPDFKLIDHKNLELNLYPYNDDNKIYFIEGDKDTIWLTASPPAYIEDLPIEIPHFKAITKNPITGYDPVVYQYDRNGKQWSTKHLSPTDKNGQTIETRCDLDLNYDRIVTINGHKTSNYGTAQKVMLIQLGKAYVHFNDSNLHVQKLKNCTPTGVKRVWDFGEIIRPAAYYETAEGLEVVGFGHHNTIEHIKIDLNDSPPLWRWFFYFYYNLYGVYIIGLVLTVWFILMRRKSSKKPQS
ncbi:hypothetical protein MHTCC0001_31990 [Flavobacteriaceae bacterium MHTCC 0001]